MCPTMETDKESMASNKSAEQMAKILLEYLSRRIALKLTRELHNRVEGGKSVTDTFARVVEYLAHMEDD